MIARLSYVMCDECGSPASPADDAREARGEARGQGFIRTDDGRDLCPACKPGASKEKPYNPFNLGGAT